jgi:3-isopropylmalate/(R)-2-methylmalate dehydratase large subunit
MKVEFVGKPSKFATAKDIVMKLIANIGIGGAGGHVIEYVGDVIESMSMDERMTVCNMSIECGARAGLISPDEKTFAYLKGKKYAPTDFDDAINTWKKLVSDTNANYDKTITVNIENLEPMVTWGINPQHAVSISAKVPSLKSIPTHQHALAKQAYDYTGFSADESVLGKDIQWAFVGSCTNGRIEDMRAAASVLKGNKISDNVTMYIVPGSEQVRTLAIAEGLDKIFAESGAQIRNPGCSMCLAMNDDKVPEGMRCISTSNRNFIGLQGKGSITHLASPQTVAASAIMGKICSVDKLSKEL